MLLSPIHIKHNKGGVVGCSHARAAPATESPSFVYKHTPSSTHRHERVTAMDEEFLQEFLGKSHVSAGINDKEDGASVAKVSRRGRDEQGLFIFILTRLFFINLDRREEKSRSRACGRGKLGKQNPPFHG